MLPKRLKFVICTEIFSIKPYKNDLTAFIQMNNNKIMAAISHYQAGVTNNA
jgi:hypothetical protein